MPIRRSYKAPLVALSMLSLAIAGSCSSTPPSMPTAATTSAEDSASQRGTAAVNAVIAEEFDAVTPEEFEAVVFRKLQSELMVATLSCKSQQMTTHYNIFIKRFRPELRDNARILKALFQREHGAQAQRRLDAFMTGLANKASLDSMGDASFCTKAGTRLEAMAVGSKGQTAEAQ